MNAKLPTFFPKKLLPKSHLSIFFFNYKINLFDGFFFLYFSYEKTHTLYGSCLYSSWIGFGCIYTTHTMNMTRGKVELRRTCEDVGGVGPVPDTLNSRRNP